MTIIMIKTFVGLDAGCLPWVQGHLFPKALRGAVFLCAGKWTIAKLGRNQQIPKNVLYLGKANLPSLHHPASSSQSPSTESLSSAPITATKMHSSKNLHISQSEAVLKISIMNNDPSASGSPQGTFYPLVSHRRGGRKDRSNNLQRSGYTGASRWRVAPTTCMTVAQLGIPATQV